MLRERRQLDALTRESLWAALAALATGKRISAVGSAVEEVVARRHGETNGWEAGIVEEFVGHGIRTSMHMPRRPQATEVRARRASSNMVLAVEPMLVRRRYRVVTDDDEWTVRTADGLDLPPLEAFDRHYGGRGLLTARNSGAARLAPYRSDPCLHSTE